MVLSRRAIDSIKTGAAITIAYGIALSLDWEQPRWSAITVALVSLATVGQSLNNAVERIFGTLAAGLMSLLLVGLFAQERWLYIGSLSVWMVICTYLMGGRKFEQFWQLSGFATAIIAVEAGLDPAGAFDASVLRMKETLLGLGVYTAVFLFFWPSDAYASFKSVATDLVATQRKLLATYRELMHGQLHAPELVETARQLRMQALQQQASFAELLEAAERERYDVGFVSAKWERYQEQLGELAEIAAIWRESFAEIQELDLYALLPGLRDLETEVDGRFAQIGLLLADESPTARPAAVELEPDEAAVAALVPFDRAAFSVFLNRLRALEALTADMFHVLADIKNVGPAVPTGPTHAKRSFFFMPDIDRLLGSLRVMIGLWLCYAALIYMNPIPGGANLVGMGAASCMVIAMLPQLPVKMFLPALTGCLLFTAGIYFFVMPAITSFALLGPLLFVVCTAIIYMNYAPQRFLFRGLWIVVFLTLINISNEQVYSFQNFADSAMMFYVIAVIVAVSAYIPYSPQPDRAFLRLLRRFFRCGAFLISTMRRDPGDPQPLFGAWRTEICRRELAMVPGKLMNWSHFIDLKLLGDVKPEQIQAIILHAQALNNRLQELLDARDRVDAGRLVAALQAEELRDSLRAWQHDTRETFQILADDPAAGHGPTFRDHLNAIIQRLDRITEETMDRASPSAITPQDTESIYRLLGAYRGVSTDLDGFLVSADSIDWTRWKEGRFDT